MPRPIVRSPEAASVTIGRPREHDEPSDPSDKPDVDLLARLHLGDHDALRLLYERYARAAYSLACRICRNQVVAEDVVQEVFEVLWRQSSRYSPARGTFRSWLLTVVHHKAVDAVRREQTVCRLNVPSDAVREDWSFPPGAGADEAALESVFAAQVRDALRVLPFPQRQTLLLAYYGGYTQREISALLGVPLGTVKSRMNAAVRRLGILLRPLKAHPTA